MTAPKKRKNKKSFPRFFFANFAPLHSDSFSVFACLKQRQGNVFEDRSGTLPAPVFKRLLHNARSSRRSGEKFRAAVNAVEDKQIKKVHRAQN